VFLQTNLRYLGYLGLVIGVVLLLQVGGPGRCSFLHVFPYPVMPLPADSTCAWSPVASPQWYASRSLVHLLQGTVVN
jgi:hypothetical protein